MKSWEGKEVLPSFQFFDNIDPGYGAATPVAVPQPGEQIDLVFQVPTAGLAPGLHQIDVRVKRDSAWSDTHRRFFYLNQLALQTEDTSTINAAEYYFGTVDPGYGLAQPLVVPSPGTQVTLVDELDLSALLPGFHDVSIRVRNHHGTWSDTHRRFFFLPDTSSRYRLRAIDYEIRQGNGVVGSGSVPISPAQYTVELTFDANTAALPAGFYDLCVVAVDEANRESGQLCRSFQVQAVTNLDAPALATGLRAYPNPSAGPVTVAASRAPIMAYRLSDAQGRVLHQGRPDPGSMQVALDLSALPAGTYYLAVEQAGRVQIIPLQRR
ncbi:MAG: T9SS C-terminal target domain-containing protein [Bacteroidetes bacterium]|nr:MAG: T9SS C-terminal target domain-containing protein [Bacteroidota bacterium]